MLRLLKGKIAVARRARRAEPGAAGHCSFGRLDAYFLPTFRAGDAVVDALFLTAFFQKGWAHSRDR